MTRLIVVIPTYNEKENLEPMIRALLALDVEPELSVLIVDDNSPDGTGQIADTLAQQCPGKIHTLRRAGKLGLGTAYIDGFRRALDLGADYVIQMDCDFSHDPKYIPQMIETIKRGDCDVALGSRYVKGGRVDETWGIGRKLLSWWANSVYVRAILRTKVIDATGGFRLWKREVLAGMNLDRIRSNGYVFQVEMIYVAEKLGYRDTEIPIYFPDRREGVSKMSLKVQLEAALRVWQVWARHRRLNPSQRLPVTQSE